MLRCKWLVRFDTANYMAQVFFSYTPACRRNDYSLFHYGFLQHWDAPRLCALDTPGGSLYTPSGLEEDRDYGAIVTRSYTQADSLPYTRIYCWSTVRSVPPCALTCMLYTGSVPVLLALQELL